MKKIKHPNTGQVIEVPEAEADAWLEAGWVDPTPAKKPATTSTTKEK